MLHRMGEAVSEHRVTWAHVLRQLPGGLGYDLARSAMQLIIDGQADSTQIGAFAYGLSLKGETVEELSAIRDALLASAVPVKIDKPAIDIVGTGGDHTGYFNISTASALVTAGAGQPVVKHGGRGASTATGSADVLEALGVATDTSAADIPRVLDAAGIAFCFAPNFHPALRNAIDARRSLGVPTFFNLLAPLLNPANPRMRLVGVAAQSRMEIVAETLARGGYEALVVRGHDGLDKFTVTGASDVIVVSNETTRTLTLDPADWGFTYADPADLIGSTPDVNAKIIREVLAGTDGPKRDICVLNAAAALAIVEGPLSDFPNQLGRTLDRANESIESGRALAVYHRWVELRPSRTAGESK
jgi:anthranilate phosphoribosyltransferase